MFTEGLDETAINWIKKGSQAKQGLRSLSTQEIGREPFRISSPLVYSGGGCMSPSVLPPLKSSSGLLAARGLVPLYPESDEDDGGESSVGSAPYDLDGSSFGGFEEETSQLWDAFDSKLNHNIDARSNMGSMSTGLRKTNEISIEVPTKFGRYETGDQGMQSARRYFTPLGSCQTHGSNGNGTPGGGTLNDVAELGTPSAPPIMESGREGIPGIGTDSREPSPSKGHPGCTTELPESIEQDQRKGRNMIEAAEPEAPPLQQTHLMDHSPCYDASGQNAWKTLIAYDACVRLCLNAWARGCTEAPEFLRDECLVLRSSFGLHKFLLQPRGMQVTERWTAKGMELSAASKAKKVVGKIRVEVKKLRMIPRQKLKTTHSRGSIYVQAGTDYVRHVSALMKTGITSLRRTSFSLMPEEPLSCLIYLKSCREDAQDEAAPGVYLQPGTGDYHVFFPESQGDALLVEVHDKAKADKGRATIPISSLTNNPSDRIRWWPVYHDDHECFGKIQLSIGSTIRSDENNHMKSGPVVETLAYDLLLEAALRVQNFHSRNLKLGGPWKWLLHEFSDYYGVSNSYTKLRYLSHVMDVATPTKDCLELVHELVAPVIKARDERSLSRQEKSILLDCETQIESLLANVFENYRSLDETSPTGLADFLPGSCPDFAAPALAPAVQLYTILHDILAQDVQTMLRNYLEAAAKKQCRKHMMETDEFVSSNIEGSIMDSVTISTAYLKMKNLCINIRKEIQAGIKIHNQNIFPSSIELSNITASVYSTELCKRVRSFLATCPPSCPLSHVNELLIATFEFERDLGLWNISPLEGGVDSMALFHDYIMVWVQDMQLYLLELCKAEKFPWSGVTTNRSTSPFAEDIYGKIKNALVEYEVVTSRWPQYSLILENAIASVERAVIKALERQYSDILTPLKDSIPKRLNMQVQKLARRQSVTLYIAPAQLGTFVNTIRRILDVLHCRIEDILKSWASYLPTGGDKKLLFGEQMNGITVLLRTTYKNYTQATVGKLVSNMQINRSTRLKRILEEIKEADGESDIRERMQMMSSQLTSSIVNLQDVFASRIFVAICRGFWDKMGEIVLKFLEARKENRVCYKGCYYALGVMDDSFASQMQRLQGNSLQEKDLEPPRAVIEARSILCRDTSNTTDAATYFYM